MSYEIEAFKGQLVELLSRPLGLSAQGEKAASAITQQLEAKSGIDLGARQANPLSEVLEWSSEYLDKLPCHALMLANAVIEISNLLPWYKRSH